MKCKYCKTNENNSTDSNILCETCAEIFGHSKYSEL